jgi:aspartate kinase
MQVFKFGGASVKDAAAVRNVSRILKKEVTMPTIIVVSAMGKTTNKLEEVVKSYINKQEAAAVLHELKSFHLSITSELFPEKNHKIFDEIENVFVELIWAVEEEPSYSYNHHYDQIVCMGEILSSKILSAFLNADGNANAWLDARDVIQTDNTYREGKVDFALSEELCKQHLPPLLKTNNLIVTQGFIGGTSENFTTTLGREGSDYSAALLAYFTDAEKVVIWKDVPGVLNADPKYFSNTKKLAELTYHDAIELTYFGASVIHPKTIKPLQNKNIPLHVRSFVDPVEKGTVIKSGERGSTATSYIFKDDQILISIQPKDFSFIAEENLSDIFELFSKQHVHVHLMQNSAISFSICTDNDQQKIGPLLEQLKVNYNVLYNDGVQLMTIRNYNQDIINKLSGNGTILLEQRSRHTHQMVMKMGR